MHASLHTRASINAFFDHCVASSSARTHGGLAHVVFLPWIRKDVSFPLCPAYSFRAGWILQCGDVTQYSAGVGMLRYARFPMSSTAESAGCEIGGHATAVIW